MSGVLIDSTGEQAWTTLAAIQDPDERERFKQRTFVIRFARTTEELLRMVRDSQTGQS